MLITEPPVAASSFGMPCLQHRKTPVRLMSRVRCHVSRSVARIDTSPGSSTPALLTRTWTTPKWASTSSYRRATLPSSVTSTATNCASPPLSTISATTACPASSTTSATATRPPSRARARAQALPMPLPAPVITQTLPSSLPPMRCVELREFGDPTGLVVCERPDPEPGPGEVRVDLFAASLNRREWWIRRGGKAPLPQVLGSDGAGVVSAIGPGVVGVSVGDEVVIYPGRSGGVSPAAPGPDFEILGVPSQGTYAERICVGHRDVRPRPAGWSWAEAAALPVAGITVWRALVTHGQVTPDSTVLVPGAGG